MFNLKSKFMESIQAIKPGPKPDKKDGTPDERRRVTPANKPKHPDLKPVSYTHLDVYKRQLLG